MTSQAKPGVIQIAARIYGINPPHGQIWILHVVSLKVFFPLCHWPSFPYSLQSKMASNLWRGTFQEYKSDNKNVTTNAALNMNLWIQPQKCAHEQITGVVVKKKCILRDVSKSVHQTGLNFSRAFWKWDVIINGALGGAEFLIGHFSDQERAAWLKLEQDIVGGIFATYPSPEFASLERSELFSIMWEST